MVENDPQMVITGKVRVSYLNVFKPRKKNEDDEDPRYSALLLIPKSDTATINAIKKAQKACMPALQELMGGKKPIGWKNTLRDGDEERDTEEQPEYAGHMFMNVSSKRKPGVVDQNRQPITEDDGEFGIKSGDYARVAIRAFAFKRPDAKGITFGLEHIQKWAEGEALGGVFSKAEDVFDDLEMDEDEDNSGLL